MSMDILLEQVRKMFPFPRAYRSTVLADTGLYNIDFAPYGHGKIRCAISTDTVCGDGVGDNASGAFLSARKSFIDNAEVRISTIQATVDALIDKVAITEVEKEE